MGIVMPGSIGLVAVFAAGFVAGAFFVGFFAAVFFFGAAFAAAGLAGIGMVMPGICWAVAGDAAARTPAPIKSENIFSGKFLEPAGAPGPIDRGRQCNA